MSRAVLAVLFAVTFAACAAGRSADAVARARAAESLRRPPAATYDQIAVDSWAKLNDDGVALSRLALRRATSEDVKRYAERSMQEQRGDLDSLHAWRVDWFGDAPRAVDPTLPGIRFAERSADLGALDDASDADFDRVYLEMRIPLAEAEMALARDVLARSTKDELKGLARQAIDEDLAEIEELRALYATLVEQAPLP
jgi:uncharacterized protein (DUF305 family)